jgi:uncharacterized protein YukE
MYRRKSFFHVWAATVILVVTGVPYTPAGAVLFLQDPTISSFLVPHGFNPRDPRSWVSDKEFATWTQNLLIKQGNRNAKDAKFFFQQCFGGGMLDDVQSALGNTVPWVGGSASAWFQPAYSNFQSGARAHGAWTEQLLQQLSQNQTVLNAIDRAAARDPLRRFETGQSVTANNGNTITLKDPAAASHHAIIFAGFVDRNPNLRNSIINDVRDIRNLLQQQWQGTNFTITTLLGNGTLLPGTMAATKANLQQAFANLAAQMNDTEEFLFFGHDHGAVSRRLLNVPRRVGAMSLDLETFDLFEDELRGMQFEPENIPTLTVEYTDLRAPVPLEFNGTLLGHLDPSLTELTFDIPENIIGLSNSVRILNTTSFEFTLLSKDFTTGAIGLVIPEPSTFVLFVVGAFFLLGYGWRARKRAA